MDGCPLGLGLVVEDKPTEFSCTLPVIHVHVYRSVDVHVCICVLMHLMPHI